MIKHDFYDVIIIGGGFYGSSLACFLKDHFSKVLVVEGHDDLMQRASYVNQARVHNGYHYPRHFLTAVRSHSSFLRFVEEYESCVVSDFKKYYGIAKKFSKVSARQFQATMERIGSFIEPAPPTISSLFNSDLMESVFTVQEYAFDSHKLKLHVIEKMKNQGVEILLNHKVSHIQNQNPLSLKVTPVDKNSPWAECSQPSIDLKCTWVFNTTYGHINDILNTSQFKLIPLKQEITEMSIINLPGELQDKSFTIMCGPFFSIMPFPSLNAWTLSHVRYTPHNYWIENQGSFKSSYQILNEYKKISAYPYMIQDVCRYMPSMQKSEYLKSLWEVKTTLPSMEHNDGRPILFYRHPENANVISIMGGKIDNIYDVIDEVKVQIL